LGFQQQQIVQRFLLLLTGEKGVRGFLWDKLCKDTVKSELEIAAYNRTHPPNDQKAQVTDLRKQLCGGPDGPGEKPKPNTNKEGSQTPR
jgi:hypothetical protein